MILCNSRLHKTQDLLYDSTKDFLELRFEGRTNEHGWMAEKDNLLQELDVCKQQLNISKDKVLDLNETMSIQTHQKYKEDIKVSKIIWISDIVYRLCQPTISFLHS